MTQYRKLIVEQHSLLTIDYKHVGKFGGDFSLKWIGPRDYVYVPTPGNEFYFERESGEKIVPGAMTTDAGSIPRLVWDLPGLSPWDYLPAYMIHDWDFTAHRQNIGDRTFEQVNLTLAEAIYTLMVDGVVPMNSLNIWMIYEAVSSVFGRYVWDN